MICISLQIKHRLCNYKFAFHIVLYSVESKSIQGTIATYIQPVFIPFFVSKLTFPYQIIMSLFKLSKNTKQKTLFICIGALYWCPSCHKGIFSFSKYVNQIYKRLETLFYSHGNKNRDS